ncbi:MAG: hypothetical protein K9I85_15245 [Saprospiraceae bacterium]|nr:hypothetical protein [Saprospiraceae bacterium]
MQNVTFLILGLTAFLLAGCSPSSDDYDRPDISEISIQTGIRRFDRDLFALDTAHIQAGREKLDRTYGEFSTLYFDQLLGIQDPRIAPDGPDAFLKGFLTFPATRHLYDTIQIVYPDLVWEQEAFETAFRYLKAIFPDRPTPIITTFLSEFSIANFIYGQDELAVGLDFYLGADYPYSRIDPSNAVFSNYLTRSYNRDHLVPRTLKPLLEDIVGPPAGERLIDHILCNGKVQVLMDILLPGIADTARIEFTPEQLTWCRDNEQNIWAYFLSENLLYSTDYKEYRKFVEYSPHSPGMPLEAPGRTGDWIGAQIVRSWLKRHPEQGIAALADRTDSQVFLDEAKYKPRR